MKEAKKTAVIIVAAGRGERAGGEQAGGQGGPKQYQQLGGKTVLERSLLPFLEHPQIDAVVVVIHADDRGLYSSSVPGHNKLLPPVDGGATRQLSCAAGLAALENRKVDRVLIHDAARPFIDAPLISVLLEKLDTSKAVLPACPVTDTLKRGNHDNLVAETVSRENLYAAQTPQGFCYNAISAAHKNALKQGKTDFTDDSALAEWAEIPVHLVNGSPANVKLTTRADMKEAQRKLNIPLPDVRVGHGYDTHQLVEGDSVRLCGVDIAHTHRLSGHSDADVGLHALTDALLATIGDGDIGSHFPPSDVKWKGADSDQFLKHAANKVRQAGGIITHLDVTLLCEAPKIGPNRETMRAAVSAIAGIDLDRISVKATTNEKMGFIGREEGIVALATATVVMGTL